MIGKQKAIIIHPQNTGEQTFIGIIGFFDILSSTTARVIS
jgi:hypothetical protein